MRLQRSCYKISASLSSDENVFVTYIFPNRRTPVILIPPYFLVDVVEKYIHFILVMVGGGGQVVAHFFYLYQDIYGHNRLNDEYISNGASQREKQFDDGFQVRVRLSRLEL